MGPAWQRKGSKGASRVGLEDGPDAWARRGSEGERAHAGRRARAGRRGVCGADRWGRRLRVGRARGTGGMAVERACWARVTSWAREGALTREVWAERQAEAGACALAGLRAR